MKPPAPRRNPGTKFQFVAKLPATAETEVGNALVAWVLFGGHGGRTRRGLGSKTSAGYGRFRSTGLGDRTSPLAARNRSILAHGFERVSEAVFDRLWTATLSLAAIDVADLPAFPKLAE